MNTLNICLSCGACCDGTLIGFVQLDQEELPAVKNVMEIEEENGNGFFLQPCKNYCDGCSIYAQRPQQCDNFKCDLLKSVEKKEVSFDTALELIKKVKQQKIAVEKKLALLPFTLQSKAFHFKMAEIKNSLLKQQTKSVSITEQQELLSDLENLNHLLTTKFGVSLY